MDENRSGGTRRGRVALAPRLESLEGRRLMAANAAQVGVKEVANQGYMDLVITGTDKADTIKVVDNGSGAIGNVTVTYGNGQTYTSKSPISVIELLGKGGNDQVSYDLTGPLIATRTVLVDLAAGNDRFTSNLAGNLTDPTGLDLEVFGGAGNDNIAVTQAGATLAGSAIPYLEGGVGNDTLSYSGTGMIGAGASLLPGLSGGAGNDKITSSYAGVVMGNYIYNLTIDGGAGNDNLVDTVHVLAGSTGTVGTDTGTPAAVMGGAGNDQVLFSVEVDPLATPKGVNAVAVGGLGKDVVKRRMPVLGDTTNETDSLLT